jgi:hypothetical protein
MALVEPGFCPSSVVRDRVQKASPCQDRVFDSPSINDKSLPLSANSLETINSVLILKFFQGEI